MCHCRHSSLTRCIEVVCFACVSSSGVNLRCARCIEVCSCVVVCCVGWLGLARDGYIFCLKSGLCVQRSLGVVTWSGVCQSKHNVVFIRPRATRTVPRASRPVNTERRSITQLLLATIAEKKWASRVRARNRLQDPSTAFVSRRHRQIFLANNAEIEAGLVHHPSVSTIFAH